MRRWLELRIPPLLVWLVFAAAMLGIVHVVPAWSFPLPFKRPLALLLMPAGAAVALAGVVAFRRHRTTVNPFTPQASTSIVSSGVYRFSRNPMYLGFLIALAGWALYLANVAAVVLLFGFAAYMTQFQIKPEERALQTKFGTGFEAYRARVRRWV